jgi:hypothetical protein
MFWASRIRISTNYFICTDPDPSINKQNIKITIISTVLCLLNDTLSSKINVTCNLRTVPVRNEQKTRVLLIS